MRSIDGDVATAAQAVVALVAEGLGVERGPVVIGIDGPSGSGKTTLADAVADGVADADCVGDTDNDCERDGVGVADADAVADGVAEAD